MKSFFSSPFLFLFGFHTLTLWMQLVLSVTVEEVEKLKQVFLEIQKENKRLSNECEFLKQQNIKVWSDFAQVSAEVKDLQQLTRVDNIEISGIPQEANEDIYDILRKVCSSISVDFNRDEISEAHRLPAKQGPAYIIVRFVSRIVRDKWLSAARTSPGNVQHIFPHLPSAPFFLNQHLTTYRKSLLDMARRLVAEGVYTFAWVKDGKVYVRKSPKSKVIRLRTFEDLDRPVAHSLTRT